MSKSTGYVGGDRLTPRRLYATPKAMSQYERLGGHLSRSDLCRELLGEPVTLLADGSPYWIFCIQGLRFVTCVSDRHSIEDGYFTIVTVQRDWAAGHEQR